MHSLVVVRSGKKRSDGGKPRASRNSTNAFLAPHSTDPVITPRTSSLITQGHALHAQGLAPSTPCVYVAGLRAYFQFCSSFSYPHFPSSEWLSMLFASSRCFLLMIRISIIGFLFSALSAPSFHHVMFWGSLLHCFLRLAVSQ